MRLLAVLLPKNYGTHLGYNDDQYKEFGANIISDENEIMCNSDIIIQLGLLSDDKIALMKDNQTLVGVFDPYNNKNKIENLWRSVIGF